MRDLYSILGVSDRATSAEIKAAYRSQVKLSHPDLHLGDSEAARRIQDINYAYRILNDPQARTAYDFKRMLPRLWARRRRRSAMTAAGLAVFIVAMTALSLTWKRPAEHPSMAGNEVSQKYTPAAHGNQTVEVSVEGRADAPNAARPAQESAPSATPESSPAAETPGDLRKPPVTEIAAVPPPPSPSEQSATPLLPGPIQQPVPQTGVADVVPSEPPARQVASVDHRARPQSAKRHRAGNHSTYGRLQRKPAGGGRIIESERTTARRDFGDGPRLVSSSAAALSWPSADEPFVNVGVRGR